MLEIIRMLTRGGKYHAPTYRVCCSECGLVYARTGFIGALRSTRSCGCLRVRDRVTKPRSESNREYWSANSVAINWRRRAKRVSEWAKRRGWDRDVDEAALEAFSP